MKKQNKFRRKALKLGIAVAAGTPLLAPLVHALGSLPNKIPPGKSIYKVEGQVFVDGKLANLDTLINENSVVETRDKSVIVFIVGKDAHLLRSNSVLRLGESSALKKGLELVSGKLLSAFGRRRGNESRVTHQTTTATIGIRGTAIYTESYPEYSYLCTCYGKIDLTSNTDSSVTERIVSAYHEGPRYIYSKPVDGKLIAEAPVINHSDHELVLLESLQGRLSPFGETYNG